MKCTDAMKKFNAQMQCTDAIHRGNAKIQYTNAMYRCNAEALQKIFLTNFLAILSNLGQLWSFLIQNLLGQIIFGIHKHFWSINSL